MRGIGALALALCLAGCGSAARHRPSSVAEAERTHEIPSRRPPERADHGAASARAAVIAFAAAYINWDAQTVARDMRGLAARSVGQARSAMELDAAETASDYELRHGGIANRGTVEAVAPLRGARAEYVVVTRESTTASATTAYEGLQPAWHVAIATVTRQGPNDWVVSGWQPES